MNTDTFVLLVFFTAVLVVVAFVLGRRSLLRPPAENAGSPPADAALRESEAKYRRMFEIESDAIFLIDNQSGQILEVNPAACQLYGYSREELLNMKNIDLSAEPDKTRQAMADEQRRIPVRYHRTHDGRLITVEITAGFLSWQGRPAHVAAIRDVSDRLATDEHLARQNRELALLNRVILATVAATEVEEQLDIVCRELGQMFALPLAVASLFSGETLSVVAEYRADDFASMLGTVLPVENNPLLDHMQTRRTPLVIDDVLNHPALARADTIRRSFEERGIVSMLVVPLLYGDELLGTIALDSTEARAWTEGEIALVARTAAAVTPSLHAARLIHELRESEARYSSLFHDNHAVMLVIDPASGAIVDANPAACHFYGFSHDELTHTPINAINMLGIEATRQEMRRAQTQPRTVSVFPHRLADGDIRMVEVYSGATTIEGQALLYEIVHDVTERKQIEAERERLISDLDAFAHTVAHDLKSPLGGIMGYASLLKNDLAALWDEVPPQISNSVNAVERISARMEAIVNELLLFAGVRTAEEITALPLDMRSIVLSAIDRLEIEINEYQATIVVPEAPWPQVLGHAPWVEEIWANYLSNAIKYGGEPPYITVGAEILSDHWARFWVRDNGRGIAPEDHARLFVPFIRLTQMRAQGHGLGLSIVRRIIDRLGGDVGVDSAPGQGSTFYFTLPRTESDAGGAAAGEAAVGVPEDDASV